jgi:hypothetical protein
MRQPMMRGQKSLMRFFLCQRRSSSIIILGRKIDFDEAFPRSCRSTYTLPSRLCRTGGKAISAWNPEFLDWAANYMSALQHNCAGTRRIESMDLANSAKAQNPDILTMLYIRYTERLSRALLEPLRNIRYFRDSARRFDSVGLK